MEASESTSRKGDVYVSHKPGPGIETVVLVGSKHIDMSAQQARDLFECLRDVLAVES